MTPDLEKKRGVSADAPKMKDTGEGKPQERTSNLLDLSSRKSNDRNPMNSSLKRDDKRMNIGSNSLNITSYKIIDYDIFSI